MPDQPVSVYTVVRQLLTDHFKLPTDEIIARTKLKGVTRADADIRKVVNKTRSEMRARKKRTRGSAGAKTPSPSAYTLAREILTAEPGVTNDDLLARVKARGVTKSDPDIRNAIRSTRSELRHRDTKPAPAAARATAEPKTQPGAPVEAARDEAALFAGVALVNKTTHLCGGVAKAREIVEAIRAIGGIDAFLVRLELVAAILASDTEL